MKTQGKGVGVSANQQKMYQEDDTHTLLPSQIQYHRTPLGHPPSSQRSNERALKAPLGTDSITLSTSSPKDCHQVVK
ncbi:hypothetical protein Pcinc_008960 [Petrolisthes cinctipes]|uniref:Uncharacterized protein n=1 Tax=Petrolisthes cinctipes TaxID=88211 RepID=A0AAE1G5J7_PETCI|nr:hypothetical protein Pcinc_008960 [Petrolisthes cinctipes]